MIIKIASKIQKFFISFFIALLLLLSFFYFLLIEGIEIDKLNLPLINIDKLYLKLDKKLILKIDKLHIKKEKKENRKKDLQNFLTSFKSLPKYFQEVDIKNIDFLNYNVTFLYKNSLYYIETDKYKFITKLQLKKPYIFLKIKKFYYKDIGFDFSGNGIVNLNSKKISIIGKYNLKGLNGNLKIVYKDNLLDFLINSNYFDNKILKKVTDIFNLDKNINDWIYKKIVAKKYRLSYLKGEINLNSKNIDINKIKGLAYGYDAKIFFHKELPPVDCKKIDIIFKDNSLYFKLKNPKYLDKRLDNSYVVIKNLTGKKHTFIDINIKTVSKIDKNILKLLKAYKIDLPLYQKSGFVDADVKIRVYFKDFNVDVNGKFITNNSLININNIDIFIKDSIIKLKNSLIYIEPSNIKIKNIIDAYIKGVINLNKNIANLDILNSNINLAYEEKNLFNIKNHKDSLSIDFKEKDIVKIFIKRLDTKIFFEDKNVSFYINNLNIFKKYSKILKDLDLKKGNIFISTKDFENFYIKSDISLDKKTIFYYKNRPIKDFKIIGNISKNLNKFNINNKIEIIYKDLLTIYINDYDIKINNLKKDSNKNIDFIVYGKKSNFIIKNHTLLSKKYILKFIDKKIYFKSFYKNSKISISGKMDNFIIDAKKLNDEVVKSFLNIEGVIGGEFYLNAKGNIDNLKGKATFYNTTLKDMALINNIMAFLNTIPSLITFSDPGYNKEGFKVKKGEIFFRLKNSILNIDKLILKGKSMDVEGSGIIDIKNNTINMVLKLQTLKKITDLIKKIPITGYILLGKEGKIYTSIKIEGDLMKPKIKTNLPKETIKAPLNIIKRTLQLPFKIFQ